MGLGFVFTVVFLESILIVARDSEDRLKWAYWFLVSNLVLNNLVLCNLVLVFNLVEDNLVLVFNPCEAWR